MGRSLPAPLHALAVLVAVLGIVLAAAPPVRAAETYDEQPTSCVTNNWGSGGTDQSGVVYIACSDYVYRYVNGTESFVTRLPSRTTDVAPSPDGTYLYFFNNDTPARMVRQPDGRYQLDARWRLSTFIADGSAWYVRARSIAVDAWGDLYLSNGGWFAAPNVILKFRPDGTLVTQFGTWGRGVGQFAVNMGIAVTRDGRSVFVSENENGRIQRFDYRGGSYAYAGTWGQTDTSCSTLGNLSAPYDVAVDPWGFVYVADTSCQRILKFTGTGQALGIVARAPRNSELAHGLAVDHTGNFVVGAWGRRYVRAADNPSPGPAPLPLPLPAPDTTAPALLGVTIPDPTLAQTVGVSIEASDDVAVTEMRTATEDGSWSDWRPFASQVDVTLSAGYGVKGLSVQVRDDAGNVSAVIYRTTTWSAPAPPPDLADTSAPTISSVTVPESTSSRTITVSLSAGDDVAVTELRTANEDGQWSAWHPFATSIDQTLTAGAGIKGVSVQVRDAARNESNVVYRTLAYAPPVPAGTDIADPVLVSATIPATTTAQVIDVVLAATDDIGVTQVRLANEDGSWSGWRPFAPTVSWMLSAGCTDKLVFVQVRYAAGRESNRMMLRTSLVRDMEVIGGGAGDTIAPSIHSVALPTATTSQTINVRIDATDNRSVAQVRLANEDGTWGPWQRHSSSVSWTLSAGYTLKLVTVQVRDAAGNESTTVVRRTQLVLSTAAADDRSAPVLRALEVPALATTQQVTLSLEATDDVAVAQVRFANEDGTWTAWQQWAPEKQWMLSVGDGLYKLVFAQVRDASGKESNVIYRRTLLQLA